MKLQNKALLVAFTCMGALQAVTYQGGQLIPDSQVKFRHETTSKSNPTTDFFGVQGKIQRMTKEFINNHPQQISALLAYLSYYKSNYQSVTPAPKAVIDALAPEAKAFADNIKRLIDSLASAETGAISTVKQEPVYVGKLKLTPAQNELYQYVINQLSSGGSSHTGLL